MNTVEILSLIVAAEAVIIIGFWLGLVKYREKTKHRLQDTKDKAAEVLHRLEQSINEEKEALRKQADAIREHYQSEHEAAYAEIQSALTAAKEKLSRFQGLEALGSEEESVRAALSSALEEAQELRAVSERMLESAREQSKAEQAAARQKAQELHTKAQAMLSRATLREKEIVSEAHLKAEQIAGKAYKALREEEHLVEAVQAIRNVIDGYGDHYVRPTSSFVDDLAADFGHTEAGAALETVRARVRAMVEQRLAASCDYAEAKRRETAIRFVLDAFNGRVESILSRVRHDNAGTLEQEIRDAFSLVNLNGEAFRNARIEPEYLDARLTELKWAVVAQELKVREREEQRRIREQIREEEKARREYEKAIREAQKEESSLKKVIEQTRADAEKAGSERRLQLEQKIAELTGRLAEAEARNQRAISMAQQTRKGNVYIISNIGSFGGDVVKIGMTRRLEPMDRVKELGDASVPFEFDVHAIIPSDDAPELEAKLHAEFDEYRVNQLNRRKEFFRVPLSRVREFVKEHHIEATFTLAADARDYRETQAMVRNGLSGKDGSL